MEEITRASWASEAPPATVKVLRVLEFVARRKKVSVADVVEYTGMPKSTVVRLLSTLTDEGFIARAAPNRYEPALKLWELGCLAVDWDDTRDVVPPVLKQLVQTTNETAHYAIYDQGRAVYIEKVDGSHPVRAYTRVGGSSPAYATATGKALLAWRPEAEIREVLVAATRFTDVTVTSADSFLRHAEEIRHAGHAINRGEWRSGVWGIAAPVFDRRHDVVGAVGLSGPAERIEPEIQRYAFYVADAARDISARFGADPEAVHQQ